MVHIKKNLKKKKNENYFHVQTCQDSSQTQFIQFIPVYHQQAPTRALCVYAQAQGTLAWILKP